MWLMEKCRNSTTTKLAFIARDGEDEKEMEKSKEEGVMGTGGCLGLRGVGSRESLSRVR